MKGLNKIRIDGHKVIYYTCNCKICRSGKPKKIVFGVGYNQESQTNKILKDVLAGDYGEEWQKLLSNNPTGTVDISAELYVCPNCDSWTNDYNLSFYILPSQFTTKTKSVFLTEGYSLSKCSNLIESIEGLIEKNQNHYLLYREYRHICPICSAVLQRESLIKDLWIDVDKLNKMKLKCPKCKALIKICD